MLYPAHRYKKHSALDSSDLIKTSKIIDFSNKFLSENESCATVFRSKKKPTLYWRGKVVMRMDNRD